MRYLFILFSLTIYSQQIKSVNFKSVKGKVIVNPIEKTVCGSALFDFNVLEPIDTIKIDAQNMSITDLKLNGISVKFTNTSKYIKMSEGFHIGKNKLILNYSCKPKQAIYFNKIGSTYQIFTQGQGKNTSNWFPSFDNVNEKLIFNLDILFDENYQVISNGNLKKKMLIGNNILWQFRMKKPMSSYLLMMAIGEFKYQIVKSNSDKTLQFFIENNDIGKLESTYKYSKEIFDFLEKEIGVDYPWKIYKQIPIRDFLYAGMENTTATIFDRTFVVDSIEKNDQNYINVNAHELSHQWFGDMVTAKSGIHHWLQEGFATYYALLAEKNILGENHFYYKMFEMAQELEQASKTDTIPILNEKASSLSFYKKSAWALWFLDEAIGHAKFQKGVKGYLKKYKFQNVETGNFFSEINKISKFDTDKFTEIWLKKSGFEIETAIELLLKNQFMRQYFELIKKAKFPFSSYSKEFESIMKSDADYHLKVLLIYLTNLIPFNEKSTLINLAMQTNNIIIRQVVAKNLIEIPIDFKSTYETLLEDKSYSTKEIALKMLWQKFPDEQTHFLNKTNFLKESNNFSFRILWLSLALQTNNYKLDTKKNLYIELLNYASNNYETITRQNAIDTLIYLNKNDQNYFPFLVDGLSHYKWQYVAFAKSKILELIKNANHLKYFKNYLLQIDQSKKPQLSNLLNQQNK